MSTPISVFAHQTYYDVEGPKVRDRKFLYPPIWRIMQGMNFWGTTFIRAPLPTKQFVPAAHRILPPDREMSSVALVHKQYHP